MLPYLEIHRENLLLMLNYGGLMLFGLILILGARRYILGGKSGPEHPNMKFPDGIEEGHGGIPVFLVVLYIFVGVWAVLYIAAHAYWGMDFGG